MSSENVSCISVPAPVRFACKDYKIDNKKRNTVQNVCTAPIINYRSLIVWEQHRISSAPVERIFSRGGIIMRPHRSRLGDKISSNLVFLKCNSSK